MSLVSDCHGAQRVYGRINKIFKNTSYNPKETAIIILGDSGLNFFLNGIEANWKAAMATKECYIYCVRGNHEERPENLKFENIYDENVKGNVYIDSVNSKIRYFQDGGEYNINNHSILTIGGAYSIDKNYRLIMGYPYFKDELLTIEEMQNIEEKVKGKYFDFVLTHTCPLSLEPKHLFLSGYNQILIDKSMEEWLDKIKEQITYKEWYCGHFHSDEILCENHYLLYHDFINLFDFN